jgi:uncharacterized protein YgiM (DUF1202 family)
MKIRTVFVALAFVILTGAVFAYRMPSRGEVTASALNVRTGPGTNYTIITSVPQGTVVEIIDVRGNWYKVNVGSNTGAFVHSSYVKVTEMIEVDDPEAEKESTKRFMPTLQNVDPSTR